MTFGFSKYMLLRYRKIPIIKPWAYICCKGFFLLGLFSGVLILGGACYRREFCVSNWVWLLNKNNLKH